MRFCSADQRELEDLKRTKQQLKTLSLSWLAKPAAVEKSNQRNRSKPLVCCSPWSTRSELLQARDLRWASFTKSPRASHIWVHLPNPVRLLHLPPNSLLATLIVYLFGFIIISIFVSILLFSLLYLKHQQLKMVDSAADSSRIRVLQRPHSIVAVDGPLRTAACVRDRTACMPLFVCASEPFRTLIQSR